MLEGMGDASAMPLENQDGSLLWIKTPPSTLYTSLEAKAILPNGTASELKVVMTTQTDVVCVQAPAYYPTDVTELKIELFHSGKPVANWRLNGIPTSVRQVKGQPDGRTKAGPAQIAGAFWRKKSGSSGYGNYDSVVELSMPAHEGENWEFQRDDVQPEFAPKRREGLSRSLMTTRVNGRSAQLNFQSQMPMVEMQNYASAPGRLVRFETTSERFVFHDLEVVRVPKRFANRDWFVLAPAKPVTAVGKNGVKVTLLPFPKDDYGGDMAGMGPYLTISFRIESSDKASREPGLDGKPLPVTFSLEDEKGTSIGQMGIGKMVEQSVTGRDFAGNATGPKKVSYRPGSCQIAYPSRKVGRLPELVLTVVRRVDRETFPFVVSGPMLPSAPPLPLLR